jgi:hypothetical protein
MFCKEQTPQHLLSTSTFSIIHSRLSKQITKTLKKCLRLVKKPQRLLNSLSDVCKRSKACENSVRLVKSL